MPWPTLVSTDGETLLVVDPAVAGGAIVYWGAPVAGDAADTAAALERIGFDVFSVPRALLDDPTRLGQAIDALVGRIGQGQNPPSGVEPR